jgi:transcriptional antiterminator RfaH
MPILAAEPDLDPPTLLDSPPGEWFVARTRPRQEKALARVLRKSGIGNYLPCLPRRNRIRGRIVVARIPIFAGYVFVNGGPEAKSRTAATGRVVELLPVADAAGLQSDLRRVHCLTGSGLPLAAVEDVFIGTPVRIHSGPMTGLTGRVVRSQGRCRLIVAVEMLGRGVAVEVEAATLTRLN